MRKHLGTIAVVLAFSACNRSPSAPTPAGTDGQPGPVAGSITLEMRGRVVDDLDKPVAGVLVTLAPTAAPDPGTPGGATSDGNGFFAFSARVLTSLGSLETVPIEVRRDGYEGAELWIPPNSDTTFTMYPTITVRAGSTLPVRVAAGAPYACGFESHPCRRIVVEPAGEPVVVEVFEADGEEVGLVDGEPPMTPFDYERLVTVTDGELFIIGGPATVTLQARAPDPLVGLYTLTLTHGCTAMPEAARTRTYSASIGPAATGLVVTLGEASFFDNSACTTELGLGCNQFVASREGDRVRFDLVNGEWHGGYISERLPPGGWLVVYGSATGRVEQGTITATGSGGFWYCPTNAPYPGVECGSAVSCESADLSLTFTRR